MNFAEFDQDQGGQTRSRASPNRSNGVDPILAVFRAADLNQDGTLDHNEFRLFLDPHLR